MAGDGTLLPDSVVWVEGGTTRRCAKEIPGLFKPKTSGDSPLGRLSATNVEGLKTLAVSVSEDGIASAKVHASQLMLPS